MLLLMLGNNETTIQKLNHFSLNQKDCIDIFIADFLGWKFIILNYE